MFIYVEAYNSGNPQKILVNANNIVFLSDQMLQLTTSFIILTDEGANNLRHMLNQLGVVKGGW